MTIYQELVSEKIGPYYIRSYYEPNGTLYVEDASGKNLCPESSREKLSDFLEDTLKLYDKKFYKKLKNLYPEEFI